VKDELASSSWLQSWVSKDKDDDDDDNNNDANTKPEESEDATPSWFARWVDGVTVEDAAVLDKDNDGNDSDGSLDDDFASDEEEEQRRNTEEQKLRKSSGALQGSSRGIAGRKAPADKVSSSTSSFSNEVRVSSTEGWSPAVAKDQKEVGNEESERRKIVKNMLDRAIRTFNVNSKRGVKYVIESGMVVSGDAGGMAEFLVTTKGLNKEKVC
jgi:Skp family chaperone for outer membrane proteins